ncbi:MAG: hypothetical protein ABSC94_31925 [Polyangiaceae bacterium]
MALALCIATGCSAGGATAPSETGGNTGGTSSTGTTDNGQSGTSSSSTNNGGTSVSMSTYTTTYTSNGTVVTMTTSSEVTSTSGSPGQTSTSNTTSSGTSGSSSSGIADAGADGGLACTNTSMSTINIDSSGWVCDNQWGIQGAWYCYADTAGTSDCGPTGYIPYSTTSNAMCISGVTSTSTNGATAYGAGIGLVLDQPAHGADAGKDAFDATAKNIVGFAITISGNTGGSVLNINFPPALLSTGESAAVTVPGVSGTSVTYNVLIADAIISDNATSPIPKIDPTKLTDVQVALPGADGIQHTYNYCITKIVPLMAAPTAPGTLTAYGPTFNEGKQIVLEGLGPYGVQNDPFGVGTDQMTMTASYGGGQVGFSATPSFGPTGNTPGAFPAIVYGWTHGGNYVGTAEGGYAGGKAISALSSVKSSWSYTPGSGNWDAAYDCWLAANPTPISAGFELMVWLGHSNVNPIGGQNTAVTVTGATGTWTVSNGTNSTGQPVVSYVSSSNMTSVTDFDLLPFFKEAASSGRGGLSSADDLLSVQAGFELYNSGTWTTNSYSISVQ